jgi:four helix bundle suffix protein
MIQAARSGTQNIAEGSSASATSKKTELKLTQVARASLEELRLDYEDYLRQNRLQQWDHENPLRQNLIDSRCKTADDVADWVKQACRNSALQNSNSTKHTDLYPEYSANAALVLLTVACSLLDHQVEQQADSFKHEGGFTERLYRVRTEERKREREAGERGRNCENEKGRRGDGEKLRNCENVRKRIRRFFTTILRIKLRDGRQWAKRAQSKS